MKDKLLRVPHRHVVMTLPHVLLDLVKRNKKEILNIMMRTSAEALKIWMMKAFGLKNGRDSRTAYLWRNQAVPCPHAHDPVMGAALTGTEDCRSGKVKGE